MAPSQRVQTWAWASASLATFLAITAWGSDMGWRLSAKSPPAYQIFPLLGLLAFGLMWSHYVTSAYRTQQKVERYAVKRYLDITSTAVLVLILLHPGLLIIQLWRDGYGLPPNSYLQNYVAPSLKWATLLGSLALIAFLAYELRRKYTGRPWWKFVGFASDAAMVAIFIHGLKLGRNLSSGWFVYVWYAYAVTFAVSLAYVYYTRYAKRTA